MKNLYTAVEMIISQKTKNVTRIDCIKQLATFDPAVGVPVPLAAGGRVAIMGQLFFAPWAWAYSALHP